VTIERLQSYASGSWTEGSGPAQTLVDPATEEALAETSTGGIDFGAALAFARKEGGAALRALTFEQRGELLRAMSKAIHGARDGLLDVGMKNGGNTRGDAKFDVDGAMGTLAYYAEIGKALGPARALVDGDGDKLGRTPRFVGEHVLLPRAGVAVHVNAFNFPAWGFGEKAACALLAGMPIVVKPATSTALLAHRIAKLLEPLLPKGALTFVCGPPGDLLEHLGPSDCIAFTGSSDTGATIRRLEGVARRGARVNVEADSLNAAVLAPDAAPGSETFNLFVRDVARDVTQKTGQKCTAIRRILVPAALLGDVRDALVGRLAEVVVGNTAEDRVTMGPVATAAQHHEVRAGLERLRAETKAVTGAKLEPVGSPAGKGFFVAPTLLEASGEGSLVHELEVFGPVSTLIAYDGAAESAARLVARGAGTLVSSVYTDDRAFAEAILFAAAPWSGRLFFGSEKIADQTPGPGTVLPHSVHGGPGRAGGGEELGGVRGLAFYSQRTAIQGARPMLDAMLASAVRWPMQKADATKGSTG